MNTKVKKIMPFVLILIIVLSIIISILASPKTYAATTEDGLFEYSVQNNYVKITKYLGSQSVVTIPSTIDNFPVTTIGKSFLENDVTLQINIPSSVSNIEVEAFTRGYNLTKINVDDSNLYYANYNNDGVLYDKNIKKIVQYPSGKKDESFTIPNTVESIGEESFFQSGYKNKDEIYLKTINIPSSIKIIEKSAFFQCYSLTTVNMESGIKEIGSYAFGKCTKLKQINIPESIEIIRDNAFSECSSLETISIPENVTTIEGNPFAGLALTMVIVDPANKNYANYNNDGILYDKNFTTIICYPRAKNETLYTLPESITKIGDRAFYGSSLSTINIPDKVTNIGKEAFYQCYNLSNVELPSNLVSLGVSAFKWCKSIEKIVIPGRTTRIEQDTFAGCQNLKEIVIPDSVKSSFARNLWSRENY